jgi:hypothetical protein
LKQPLKTISEETLEGKTIQKQAVLAYDLFCDLLSTCKTNGFGEKVGSAGSFIPAMLLSASCLKPFDEFGAITDDLILFITFAELTLDAEALKIESLSDKYTTVVREVKLLHAMCPVEKARIEATYHSLQKITDGDKESAKVDALSESPQSFKEQDVAGFPSTGFPTDDTSKAALKHILHERPGDDASSETIERISAQGINKLPASKSLREAGDETTTQRLNGSHYSVLGRLSQGTKTRMQGFEKFYGDTNTARVGVTGDFTADCLGLSPTSKTSSFGNRPPRKISGQRPTVSSSTTLDLGYTRRGLLSPCITEASLCSMFKIWAAYGNDDWKDFAECVLKNAGDSQFFPRGVWSEEWIEDVPLPCTAQQMALTGSLFDLNNFGVVKVRGSGSFASVFEACPAYERVMTTAFSVATKMEYIPLHCVQQTLVEPLVQGTAVQHDGIAEILAYCPVSIYFHRPEGKSSVLEYTEDDWHEVMPQSYVIVVTFMECGKHTLDDEFESFFE